MLHPLRQLLYNGQLPNFLKGLSVLVIFTQTGKKA